MKSGGVISQSLLFKLDPDMAFQSSPLVCAAQLGRQDLVHLMMKILQFEVDYSEEHTGLNALAAAVQTQNKRMIKYLVKVMGANINEKLTLLDKEGNTLQCTPFILAMFQTSGPELMDLPPELGADLHYRFLTEGLRSLITNIVLKQNNKENYSKILSKLLSHGFKLDHPLWDNLGNPFHCHLPIELAIHF
jgi:Ankyrin repeats (3 copies)